MGAFYLPFLRIQIVGTVSDVLHKTEHGIVPGDKNKAHRSVGRKGDCLTTQIGNGLRVCERDYWKSIRTKHRRQGKRMIRNDIVPLDIAESDARRKNTERQRSGIVQPGKMRSKRQDTDIGLPESRLAMLISGYKTCPSGNNLFNIP